MAHGQPARHRDLGDFPDLWRKDRKRLLPAVDRPLSSGAARCRDLRQCGAAGEGGEGVGAGDGRGDRCGPRGSGQEPEGRDVRASSRDGVHTRGDWCRGEAAAFRSRCTGRERPSSRSLRPCLGHRSRTARKPESQKTTWAVSRTEPVQLSPAAGSRRAASEGKAVTALLPGRHDPLRGRDEP